MICYSITYKKKKKNSNKFGLESIFDKNFPFLRPINKNIQKYIIICPDDYDNSLSIDAHYDRLMLFTKVLSIKL